MSRPTVGRCAALLLALGTSAVGCRHAPALAEAPVSDPSTGPRQPLVATLAATERARLRALVAGDTAAASAYHAPDFELITPGGARMSKAAYLAALATGALDYRHWEPVGSIAVRTYAGGAVLRYQADLEAVFEGQALPRRRFWHTDVYELRDGRWQVVWSQATATR